MLVAIEEHALELQSWNDKSSMLQVVNCCDGGAVILGEDSEQELEFYSVIVHFNYAAQIHSSRYHGISSWGIGLISEGHGLKPQLIALPNRTLVFGLNHEVLGLSPDSRSIIFRHGFDTLFHALLYLSTQRILVVRNEIGIIVLDEYGKELWRFEKDIVTNCSIEEWRIELHFLDTAPIVLDLLTGRVVDRCAEQ